MACASNCPDQDCPTYGACLRKKGVRVGWANSVNGLDKTSDKRHENELALYRSARDQGIQPDGTQIHQVKAAIEISNRTGQAYQSGV